jgi:hypothetical protein
MAKVAIDHVPTTAQPEPVAAVLREAAELRTKLREATDRLAQLQSKLGEQEQADVEAAAAAIRQGASPPTISAGIAKTRAAIETQTRQVQALTLANDACQADLVSTLIETSTAWREALDAEVEQARQDGRAAITAIRDACQRLGDAVSTQHWLDQGRDGDFAHRPVGVNTGDIAPSSRRRTLNSEAMHVDELLNYIAEALEPPPSAAALALRVATDAA